MYKKKDEIRLKKGMELYLSGVGAVECAAKGKISYLSMRNFLKSSGAWRYPIKYPQFESIDTEEKAYWLGFLYADGYVNKNSNSIEFCLQEKDYSHVVKFSRFMGINDLSRIKRKTVLLNGKKYFSYRITITDKLLKENLIELGCVPNKSLILKFPSEKQVPKYLVRHFVRGYIDGDGSIGRYRKNQNRPQLQILGTPEFLHLLIDSMGWKELKFGHNKHHSDRTFFAIWEASYVQNYLDDLYLNSTIYLDRKAKIALPFLAEM